MSCDSRMNEETSGHCEAGRVGMTGLALYSGSVWPSTVLPSCESSCADIYRSPALGDSWAQRTLRVLVFKFQLSITVLLL